MKFDIVIGNPPYQETVDSAAGVPIWHHFVDLSLNVTVDGGDIALVHPWGWRKDKKKFQQVSERLRSLQINKCKLSNYDTGIDLFHVNTSCDWYSVTNTPRTDDFKTRVVGIDGTETLLDLSDVRILPDTLPSEYMDILSLDGKDAVGHVHTYDYSTTKKTIVADKQSDEFKHSIVYTLTLDGPTFKYTNDDTLGHFGVPKVILGRGVGMPVLDIDGEYATCEFSHYLLADTKEELESMYSALKTPECIKLLKAIGSGKSHNYLPEAVKLLKKDFWKRFV